ncbi:helix-turn-helix domain-containing protein [Nocardia sp. NPDC058058]|uniref:helix-turn-helix domain-containing protein n=1 Tax=Nocardia sp. NPDC058058 TaxID=3346317 RepID=UPI0036DC64B3
MVEVEWTAREIRALRTVLKLSVPEFARHVGVSARTLILWESGATDQPRAASRRLLDSVLLGIEPGQLERFRAALTISPLPGISRRDDAPRTESVATDRLFDEYGLYTWEVDEDVRRRDFGRAVTTGTAMLLMGEPTRIGAGDVRRLLGEVDALEREDQRQGGAALVGFGIKQLSRHKQKLETGTYSTVTGSAYASATGELAVLTGWLAYDADQHHLARRCYADAMALGSESGDSDLIAHTCLYAANQSIALSAHGKGSPTRALLHIDRARQLMRGKPPGRIHVLIAIREAQARGILGDRAGFGRAISTAWRELGDADEFEPLPDCPSWLRSVNQAEVRGHEARGWTRVGEPAKAVDLFELAVREDERIRNALNNRACLASARAELGDLSGALRDADPILNDLEHTVTSIRTLKALTPLRKAVTGIPEGAAFSRRFDTLTAKAHTQ